MIFKRKKKKLENFNALELINDVALPLTPFGEKIIDLEVVFICINGILSQCAKFKTRCIKEEKMVLLPTIVIAIINYGTLTRCRLEYKKLTK